ncbi:MAG: hypothetical protein JO256_10770 [Alphaproteobacteria bacterium]|nr:hypothetical protein [Alphaproteobacteria bacterium]
MSRLLIIPLMILFAVSPLRAQQGGQNATAQSDCEVYAAAFVARPPHGIMISGLPGADCNWKSLGVEIEVAAVLPDPTKNALILSLSRPTYSSDGSRASFMQAGFRHSNPPSALGGSTFICTDEKRGGRWKFVGIRLWAVS